MILLYKIPQSFNWSRIVVPNNIPLLIAMRALNLHIMIARLLLKVERDPVTINRPFLGFIRFPAVWTPELVSKLRNMFNALIS